jgi:hypothetical protein
MYCNAASNVYFGWSVRAGPLGPFVGMFDLEFHRLFPVNPTTKPGDVTRTRSKRNPTPLLLVCSGSQFFVRLVSQSTSPFFGSCCLPCSCIAVVSEFTGPIPSLVRTPVCGTTHTLTVQPIIRRYPGGHMHPQLGSPKRGNTRKKHSTLKPRLFVKTAPNLTIRLRGQRQDRPIVRPLLVTTPISSAAVSASSLVRAQFRSRRLSRRALCQERSPLLEFYYDARTSHAGSPNARTRSVRSNGRSPRSPRQQRSRRWRQKRRRRRKRHRCITADRRPCGV